MKKTCQVNVWAHGAGRRLPHRRRPIYPSMSGHFETSAAYKAALDLVLKGLEQPSGYTKPLLHGWRLNAKATASLITLSS